MALGAGEALHVTGAQRQRQVEPDPDGRGAARARARGGSSAPRRRWPTRGWRSIRELPLRRALAFWGGPRLGEALAAFELDRLGRGAGALAVDRAGQARAAGAGDGERGAAVAARRAAQRARPRRAGAARRGDRGASRRAAARCSRRATCRLAASGARWRCDGALVAREMRRALAGAAWLPVAFFLLVATIVPFAVGPDAQLLGADRRRRVVDRGADRGVAADRAAGRARPRRRRCSTSWRCAGVAEEAIGAAKIAGHWLTFGPLLLVAAVPASVMVGLDGAALGRCLVALAIGTPALAALAVAVAALTSGLPRAGRAGGAVADAAGGAAADLRRGGDRATAKARRSSWRRRWRC